ncbi:hypothetical protein BSNK01_20340 [Bacillaceae bacterium]
MSREHSAISRKMIVCITMIMIILLTGCRQAEEQPHDEFRSQSTLPAVKPKPVVLFIVDSLMDRPLRSAVQSGKAPAFRFLMERGQYHPNVVSSFPTMSVVIESTLLTGTYPDRHHVPGLVWFHDAEQRIVNYGNGKREVLKIGSTQVLQDTLVRLNHVHLNPSVKTIHEELAEKGLDSASINAFVYRGPTLHRLTIPKTAAYSSPLPEHLETRGPRRLSLGTLSRLNPANDNDRLWQKLGFNDRFAIEELKFLIQQGRLPFLTIVYLPDNDHRVHGKGPQERAGIEETDRRLQEVLNMFPSWDKALQQVTWVIIGDSGQTAIRKKRDEALIRLRESLDGYRIARLREVVGEDDEIVLAVNERMAYVYALRKNISLPELARRLQKDERIDTVAWKDEGWIHVASGGKTQRFSFRPNGPYSDRYGQAWSLRGAPEILDLAIDRNRRKIDYGDYPDALARLYGALHSHEGRFLVVTARPGYELVGESSPTHLGGAGHGSLHKQDSLAPMIIAGTDTRPRHMRLIDVKDWLLSLARMK